MKTPELPNHWIGVRKDWELSCQTFAQALVSVPPALLRTHAYAIGATGSGKTTGIHHFIAQDVLLGHSFVVFDMRGDLVAAALEICAGRLPPEKIKVFDLRERERPLGFNPLFGAGEPYFRALNVLDVVENEHEGLGVQLAETLRNSVLLLAETQSPLTKLEALLTDSAYRTSLLSLSRLDAVKAFFERYNSLSQDRRATYIAPVLNKLSLLFSTEGLRRMLGHQKPVDLGKHLNTPGSVTLISLAVDELHGASRMMGSLFLSSICREVFARVNVPEEGRVPLRLYVDEFENFNNYNFESILAEGRRFKLFAFLAHQTLAQISPKIRSMILGNVGIKIVFRTGREDAHILSKDLTGDARALDLASLPTGEAIVWQRNEQPCHVELNEPLFPNIGVESLAVKQLRAKLRDLAPSYVSASDADMEGDEILEQEPLAPTSLGDWL